MDVVAAYAAVDGEIVDALLALLDERVAIEFPTQVLGAAVDLLHRLVHRHGAYGDGAVPYDPFARLVDIFSGR